MDMYDKVIELANQIPLDEYGKSYLNAMRYIDKNNEEAIRTQVAYILSNAFPKTEKEKKAFSELQKISNPNIGNELKNEILMERISQSFERFTESKVKSMPDEEDIWELEDSDVLKCSGKDNELVLKDDACYVMSNTMYEAFKRLPEKTKDKIRDLAKQFIVFETMGVYPKPPRTDHRPTYGFFYDDKVEEYCSNKYEKGLDVLACEVEATVEGKIDGKPYDEWRIDHLRNDIKEESWMFDTVNALTEEERDREVDRLNSLREKNKISFNDFKRFSQTYDYPLDLVLKANPWVEDVLTDDAKIAIKKAEGKR